MREFKSPTGILRYLVGQGKGNEIDVTVSCNETKNRPPRLIITYPNTDHWASCTTFDFNQHIQVKLKYDVFIKGYSFEKHNGWPGVYMMNWEFLGSINGKKWDVLDKHVNDSSFSRVDVLRPKTKKGIYRYFRVLNKGLNHYNNYAPSYLQRTYLYIRYLDLYGFICYNEDCLKKKDLILYPLFIWIIL